MDFKLTNRPTDSNKITTQAISISNSIWNNTPHFQIQDIRCVVIQSVAKDPDSMHFMHSRFFATFFITLLLIAVLKGR